MLLHVVRCDRRRRLERKYEDSDTTVQDLGLGASRSTVLTRGVRLLAADGQPVTSESDLANVDLASPDGNDAFLILGA